MRIAASFLITVSLAAAPAAWSQAPTADSEARLKARARYAQVNSRIHGKSVSKAEYEESTSQLRMAVAEQARAALGRSADAAQLSKAIADVQGDFAFSSWGPDTTNVPFAEGFRLLGKPGMAVGFVILRGGSSIPDTLPVLQFYAEEFGEWKLKAETDADFHGCTYMVSSLDSQVPGESWWLVWGQTIGDTGARRKIRLYSFDGNQIKTIWQRGELAAGRIKVLEDRKTIVILHYWKAGTLERPSPDPLVREEWYLTPSGPEMASSVVVGDAASPTAPQL
jgi:hypothetical protein